MGNLHPAGRDLVQLFEDFSSSGLVAGGAFGHLLLDDGAQLETEFGILLGKVCQGGHGKDLGSHFDLGVHEPFEELIGNFSFDLYRDPTNGKPFGEAAVITEDVYFEAGGKEVGKQGAHHLRGSFRQGTQHPSEHHAHRIFFIKDVEIVFQVGILLDKGPHYPVAAFAGIPLSKQLNDILRLHALKLAKGSPPSEDKVNSRSNLKLNI